MAPIRIAWCTGRGPTRLSASDAALAAAGVHDYNLIELSSVIPAGATVEEVGVDRTSTSSSRASVPRTAASPAGSTGRGTTDRRRRHCA